MMRLRPSRRLVSAVPGSCDFSSLLAPRRLASMGRREWGDGSLRSAPLPTATSGGAATSWASVRLPKSYRRATLAACASSNAPRDTRIAGRKRFYKVVGVSSARPPWEALDATNGDAEEDGASSSQESPISAGVDGTQSATGVSASRPTTEALRHMQDQGGDGEGESGDEPCDPHWYGVTLDGQPLRTPLSLPLSVPSLPLALAVAAEWDDQRTTISPAQMPLTTLVCTALDQTSSDPRAVRDNVLRFLKNDTTCYRADPTEDRVLHRRQDKSWSKLHDWAEGKLGCRPAVAVGNGEGIVMSRARAGKGGLGTAGLPHPKAFVRNAERWLEGVDAWRLTAMQAVATESKSFLVGMAVVCGALNPRPPTHQQPLRRRHDNDERGNEPPSTPPPPFADDTSKAVLASRVDEEFQIENWGLVEGGHDYDRLNCSVSIHAAKVLALSIAVSSCNSSSKRSVTTIAPDGGEEDASPVGEEDDRKVG